MQKFRLDNQIEKKTNDGNAAKQSKEKLRWCRQIVEVRAVVNLFVNNSHFYQTSCSLILYLLWNVC